VELQFNKRIKALQTEWGGEFRSFTNFLSTHGISHRQTCPHTSHQNGSIERKQRQIVETGLCLLSHASLPLKFWDHAFITAVYLINRLPTAALNFQIPYVLLFGNLLDYQFLRVFSCSCYPFLRPYDTNKLQFRSKECVFLGYSPSHKGYKCLSSEGRLYISKDVIFNESSFPYTSLFPSTSTSQSVPTSIPTFLNVLTNTTSVALPQSSSPNLESSSSSSSTTRPFQT